MHAIPERLRDASCGGAIQIVYLYPLLLDLHPVNLGLTAAGSHMSDWQHQEVHSSQRCTKSPTLRVVSRYQNVSILDFIGAKDDGGGEW